MTIDPNTFASIHLYLPRVIIATLCGSIVGVEREYKGKPAGLRTMVLICVGCTIFTTIALNMPSSTDASKIIAQIITGIGFLGGGVIMKNDDRIMGVTTAAFIWVIAAIGIMIGVGEVIVPTILTIGLLITSLMLTELEKIIHKINKKNKLNT